MRRRPLIAASIVVGILVALVTMVSIASADPPPQRTPPPRPNITVPKGRIIWSTPVITRTLAAGEIYTATVTFTSTQPLTNAVISIMPNAPLRLRATPAQFALVPANTPTSVQLEVMAPANIKNGRPLRFNAMVSIKVGRVTLPQGLRVQINVPKSPRVR